MPRTVARRAVRSYRTLSPLPAPEVDVRDLGGLLSAALSVGLRRPGVTWHSALWSPDFPPPVALTGTPAATVWPTPAASIPVPRVRLNADLSLPATGHTTPACARLAFVPQPTPPA